MRSHKLIPILIVLAAVVLTLILQRPRYSPTTATREDPPRHEDLPRHESSVDRADVTATGTFSTEKLRVTGTGGDSFIDSGAATINGSPGFASLTVNATGTDRAVLAASVDNTSVRGTRTGAASTANDVASVYGLSTGTVDTTAADQFNYGTRGQNTITKSNVGGHDLYDWGVFGRSGTNNVENTATESAGVSGFGFGGTRNTYSFYGVSKSANGNVYGVYTHADYTGIGAGWAIGTFGYANSGPVEFGAIAAAENPGAAATTSVGVWGVEGFDEGGLGAIVPVGRWAGYFTGNVDVDGHLDVTSTKGRVTVSGDSIEVDGNSAAWAIRQTNNDARSTPFVFYGVDSEVQGSFDTSVQGKRTYGVHGTTITTVSAGANGLRNIGVYGYAEGGTDNRGGWFECKNDGAGNCVQAGDVALQTNGVNALGGPTTVQVGGFNVNGTGELSYLKGNAGIGTLDTNSTFIFGHVRFLANTPPIATGCSAGAQPTVLGSDESWEVVPAAGATGCVINYITGFSGGAPNCVVTAENGLGITYVSTNSDTTMTTGVTPGVRIHGFCPSH